MTKNPWSKKELEILHNLYPVEGKLIAEKLPNRTYGAIRQKAKYDGIRFEGISCIGQNAWTDKETQLLKNYYPLLGSKVADYFPHRSVDSVLNKASRLKLTTERGSKVLLECKSVYLIYFKSLNIYKIGISKNINKRIKQFGEEAVLIYFKNCNNHIEAKNLEKLLLEKVNKINTGLLISGNSETFKASEEEIKELGKNFS